MRIVAGKYGSRSLKSPKNDATRPTQDKIKGPSSQVWGTCLMAVTF